MGREEKRQSLNETCTKVLNTSWCAFEVLRAWQHLAPLDSQDPYSSTHVQYTLYSTKGAYSWRYVARTHLRTSSCHVKLQGLGHSDKARRVPPGGTFSAGPHEKRTPPAAAVQRMGRTQPHKPSTPARLAGAVTCAWNPGLQPEKWATLLHSKHARQTHDGTACETRPMETKCRGPDRSAVFTEAADYIFLL